MVYEILHDYPDSHRVEPSPVELWLISTLEVTIRHEGRPFFLLTYPSYSLSKTHGADIGEGYWTPPHVGFHVHFQYSAPGTVGRIKEAFSEFERKVDVEESMRQAAYLMGLSDPDISECGSFIELKTSPRSPNLVKCYKIMRFCVTGVGERSRRNLGDPECRKGYIFLPLEDMETVLTSRWSEPHGRNQLFFLGKPLISNVEYIVGDAGRLAQTVDRAINLATSDFFREENGILLCCDLAGYGTACKYATEEMGTFDLRGKEVATDFRESVAKMFYELLGRAGVSQVHMAGDGFIAAIPERLFLDGDVVPVIHAFFDRYLELLKHVEELNTYIKDTSRHLGSRLAIHFGPYRYGRIARARSIGADFDGASIVEVARLEAALRQYTKGPVHLGVAGEDSDADNRPVSVKHGELSLHTVVASDAVLELSASFFETCAQLRCVADVNVGVKEFRGQAHIYEIDRAYLETD